MSAVPSNLLASEKSLFERVPNQMVERSFTLCRGYFVCRISGLLLTDRRALQREGLSAWFESPQLQEGSVFHNKPGVCSLRAEFLSTMTRVPHGELCRLDAFFFF